MVTLVFKTDADRRKHNEKCKLYMREYYKKNDGKTKSGIGYYLRKYKKNDDIMKIYNDKSLTKVEKLTAMRKYNKTI